MASMATDPGAPGAGSGCQRLAVLGIPADACPDALTAALELHARGGGQIVTLNAEMTMVAREQPELGAVIARAELVIPDGAGVVWALGRQGVRVRRSPGIELAADLLSHAERAGWRVALVGASPLVMDRLLERLQQRYPSLKPALAVHGYQEPGAWTSIEQTLLSLRPDLVLVALGVPRQETWSLRMRQGQMGLWMGVGGSFDVWSGTKQRAPAWMGRLQIEWLYRLLQEPARWQRMLALPAFAWAVLRERRA
jgi:N-acetylglucosaminyldiphosphoundecaprenol N-acetyl-beta-D-mannosaminyltransferase